MNLEFSYMSRKFDYSENDFTLRELTLDKIKEFRPILQPPITLII